MSNQLATRQPRTSALALMAERCCVEPAKLHSTLKNTVFKGATDDELLALVVTCNTYDLNPMLKEIYAFPKKGGGIVPMVAIDGWLKLANRQSNFDGLEVEVYGDGQNPTHATCEIWIKDRSRSVKITEYFDECFRPTEPWKGMPRRMLRNKALSQAIRVAFGVSGIYDEDEANDMREATGRVVTKANPYDDAPAPAAKEPPKKTAPKKLADRAAPVEESRETQEPVEESAPAGMRAIYEGVKVQSSPEGREKPWKLWRVSYQLIGEQGPIKEAVTFSKTIGSVIDRLEGGEEILIEIIPAEKGDTIQSLELAGDGGEEIEY